MKVKTGIFWVIDGKIFYDMQINEVDKAYSLYVDYVGGHYLKWNTTYAKEYQNDDFATYPRGRLMYSIKEKRYIIYVDECITDAEKSLIVEKFGIGAMPYVFAKDIHYTCDKCIKNKSEIFAVNTCDGVSVCRVFDGEVIETEFFGQEELQAFDEYCLAYGAYDIHKDKYNIKIYTGSPEFTFEFLEKGKIKTIRTLWKNKLNRFFMINCGYVKGSHDLYSFEAVARYFEIEPDLNAENVAKCYYKIINKRYLTDKDADTLIEDSKYILENIDLDYSLRLGNNIRLLYAYGLRNETDFQKVNEQTVFGMISDYCESHCLTPRTISNISYAIFKAKQGILNKEPFDNPDSYEFKKFLLNEYEYRLRANVLRGENELSGNLIEISNGFTTILVECGKSLLNESNQLDEIEQFALDNNYRAVIVSHNHIDHIGLVEKFSKNTLIYMGNLTKKLVQLQYKNIFEKNIFTYKDGEPFYVLCSVNTGIKITPFLCDHSQPDSYMLLFEYDENKILYTGDFRAHGRKNFDNLLSRLPDKVDTLICEGTNTNSQKQIISEVAVQNKLSKLISKTDKPVFILTPTENIDRIVGAYKATVKNDRIFIVDDSEARKLEIIGGKVPHPTKFNKVFVCYPKGAKKKKGDDFVDFRNQSLSYKEIAKRNDYVMLIKASSIEYISKLAQHRENGLEGATLVYSMWSGYKESERMKEFLNKINNLGMKIVTIHTSGHADIDAIEKLKKAVNPSIVQTVHFPKAVDNHN